LTRVAISIELTKRQETIVQIVKANGPITGEQIAETLSLARATLRPDLSILTMTGYLEARPRVGYYYTGAKTVDTLSKALKQLMIRDYKSVPTVISDKSSVYDAIVMMFMEDVGSLIVVKDAQLQGVVSRKDLLKVTLSGGELQTIPVNLAMTRVPHVITVSLEDTLFEAAVKMVHHEVDALPVIRSNNVTDMEVVGRVSKTTITRAFVECGTADIASL
jgi:DeoR family transcriptional regulator, catabolite repression regulator